MYAMSLLGEYFFKGGLWAMCMQTMEQQYVPIQSSVTLISPYKCLQIKITETITNYWVPYCIGFRTIYHEGNSSVGEISIMKL